jgi:hypothetical protein
MKLRNLVPVAALAAAALCMPVAEAFAQGDEEPAFETVPVLQGAGFTYRDKRLKKVDFDLNRMTMLSEGTEVLSSGRIRAIQVQPLGQLCHDVVWFMGASTKTDRTDKRIKMKQKDYAEVTFAFLACVDNVPVCVGALSLPVEVPGCSATTKTNAKQTVSKGLPPVGQSKFRCKNGINVSDPAFGLGEDLQQQLRDLFPGIESKFNAKFSDDAGTIIDTEAAAELMEPGLGLPSCF